MGSAPPPSAPPLYPTRTPLRARTWPPGQAVANPHAGTRMLPSDSQPPSAHRARGCSGVCWVGGSWRRSPGPPTRKGGWQGRGGGELMREGTAHRQLACPMDSVTCWKVLTLGPSGAKDGAGAEQEFISVQSLGPSTCGWGRGPAPCPSVPPSAVTWPQQACSASFALTFRSWKRWVRGVSRSHEVMRLEPSSSLGSSAPSFPASEPLCTECAPPMGEGN